jgi:hypothetical protein
VTPDELAPWLKVIPAGVCVTLPDGTVIDRRPLANMTTVTQLGPSVPSSTGWQPRLPANT